MQVMRWSSASSRWRRARAARACSRALAVLSLTQFFCWFAFQYLWLYSVGAIAANVWETTDPTSAAYQEAGNWNGVLAAVQSVAAVDRKTHV